MNGNGYGIRRIAAGACALLMAATLGGCSLLTPSRTEVAPDPVLVSLTEPAIATKGVLTVGLRADDAPQVMTDADGQLTGYTVDVARALAKKLGLDVTFITDAEPDEVGSSGAPDIYLGAVQDDASTSISVMGDVLEDAPALFAKGGEDAALPTARSASDFSGAVIAVQANSVSQDVLSKCGIVAEQKTCANVNECFEALESGEAQYAACDATAGAYLARSYEDIRFAGSIDATTTYGVAMRTINTDLTKAVTDALSELASDGTLDAIHAAWYGSLPVSLSDTMVSGITTSAERKAAEEAAEKEAEEEDEEAEAEESDEL